MRGLKKIVIGARCMLVLAAMSGVALAVWLAREYLAALIAGGVMFALGNVLVLAENWHLRRWKALGWLGRRKL